MEIRVLYSKDFFTKMGDDNVFEMAAALSYYTALSLSPLLILLITFVSFMGEGFKVELIRQIHSLVGGQAAEAINMIVENADRRESLRNISGFIGLITLLFSAGGIFQELRVSLNRIFEVENAEEVAKRNALWQSSLSFLKQRIFNMGMVLTFVFILIISLVISSLISFWLKGAEQFIGQLINFLVSTSIFTVLFGAIYYFLPQKRRPLRISMLSGFITALLFSFGKSLIGLYLGQSAVASAYGAAGSMIVLLMWVYYSSVIIFVSAEISHQLYRRKYHGKTF